MSVHEKRDYDALVVVLSKRFDPKERVLSYRSEFKQRKRGNGESIEEFGSDLQRLLRKGFSFTDKESGNELLIDQFVTGLVAQELMAYVHFGHPATLDEAISLAIEFEAFKVVTTAPNLGFEDSKTQVCDVSKEREGIIKFELLQSMIDRLEAITLSLEEKLGDQGSSQQQNVGKFEEKVPADVLCNVNLVDISSCRQEDSDACAMKCIDAGERGKMVDMRRSQNKKRRKNRREKRKKEKEQTVSGLCNGQIFG